MLLCVTVLAILVVIVFGGLPNLRARVEGIKCANNMRELHVILSTYLQANGHWPQEPENLWEENGDAADDWWINELKPYGAVEAIWQCPTIKRKVSDKNHGRPRVHYTPTMFDSLPGTPYKWPNMPWLMEIGNMHGQGGLVCFPDGSVRSMDALAKGMYKLD